MNRSSAFVLCALLSAGAAAQEAKPAAEKHGNKAAPSKGMVTTVIDYGDGSLRMYKAPWQAEMTVWSALDAAQTSPHPVKVTTTGSNDTVFVTQIDDLKNEGAGAGKRNWQYWLNGKLGSVGAGAQKMAKGDKAEWRFSQFEGDGAKKAAGN